MIARRPSCEIKPVLIAPAQLSQSFIPPLAPPPAICFFCFYPVMQMGKPIVPEIVRKVFEWRADGWSLADIGRQFQKSHCFAQHILKFYSEETFAPLTVAKQVT